jgi:hypothetical protein
MARYAPERRDAVRRVHTIGLAGVAAVVVSTSVILVFGRASESSSGARISNGGDPVAVTAKMRATLVRTNLAGSEVRFLAREYGRSFYELTGGPRGRCYAIGTATGSEADLNLITCGRFPAQEPVLDVSLYAKDLTTGVIRWEQVQGWANDNIARVVAVDADGATIAATTVANNVYAIDPALLKRAVAERIVAFSQSGSVVFEKNLPNVPD